MKTVVGTYKTFAEATSVKTALETEGYNAGQITVMNQDATGSDTATTGSSETLGEKIKGFFSGFSDHDDQHTTYAEHVGQGGAIVAVRAEDGDAEEIADFLTDKGALNIQGGAAQYASTSSTTGQRGLATSQDAAEAISGEQVIPIVQEEMQVGKRQVERGGVRVFTHMVETPVSADVTLRDERVVIARRAVNREATAADFENGKNVIELKETAEEAVIGKTSRVVEEVLVGKQTLEHTEQINDTVRHTEVDVEQVGATTTNRKL